MDSGLITIALLGFFLLIPIVMVVVIVGRVIKKGSGSSGIKKEVVQNCWKYEENGKNSDLLKNSLLEGHALVFTKNHVVFSVQQKFTEKVKMYAMVERIQGIDRLL